MDLIEAKNLAIQLMREHGLYGWRFDFSRGKRTVGLCNYSRKKISLSREFAQHMNQKQVANTILHEIAHALVGNGHGHNHVWRRKAIEIGCDGKRCSSYNFDIPAKYHAICPECGRIHKANRKIKRKTWCGYCNKGRFLPEMQLEYIQQY